MPTAPSDPVNSYLPTPNSQLPPPNSQCSSQLEAFGGGSWRELARLICLRRCKAQFVTISCMRTFIALTLAALLTICVLDAQAPASNTRASSYSAPRTPWGDPDLQGTHTNRTKVASRWRALLSSRASGPRMSRVGPFRGPEEFTPYVRCITRGVPGSMMPAIGSNEEGYRWTQDCESRLDAVA